MADFDDDYERLSARLPSDAMRTILLGAKYMGHDSKNPIRGNAFGSAMRELITQLLHDLAPDGQVTACAWFTKETEDGRPTRAQRQRYVVQGGLSDEYVLETLGLALEDIRKELRDAFVALNRATHVRDGSIIVKDDEVAALVDQSLSVANTLFDTVNDCRSQLLSAVADAVSDAVTEEMISRTIEEIDEKAQDYEIDYVLIEGTEATRIDASHVYFQVTGSIHANLNYGPDDDRATIEHEFPFECELVAPVADPRGFYPEQTAIKVDHGGWYDD